MNAIAKPAEQLPAEVTEMNTGVLAVIERAVRDPSVDIDKMERLLAMQERVMAEDSKRQFINALRAAKSEIKPVAKNRFNDQTKSAYANLEAVADACDPILDRNGFVLTFGTGQADLPGHYRITCDVMHIGGHERHYFADVPADMTGMKGNQNKTQTHGYGSTLSYGRRYLKLLILDVATTDDDGNSAGAGELVSEDQIARIHERAAKTGVDLIKFCKVMKVDSVPALPAARFDEAMERFDYQERSQRNG